MTEQINPIGIDISDGTVWRPTVKSCATCGYAAQDQRSATDLSCRKHAPTNQVHGLPWPAIQKQDWCGDYEWKGESF